MYTLNQREIAPEHLSAPVSAPIKRRFGILEEFPDSRFEAIIVQWDKFRPTVLIQLNRSPEEPIQFPKKRPAIPGNMDLPTDRPFALDFPLNDFVDASTGAVFGKEAFRADILLSARAFTVIQPEPDLVLPADALWECRQEALNASQLQDAQGIS